ncbi:MAG TPA: hypothetical protein DEF85_08610 [Clostridiaceae bacterium]|nr:hypothetical protein [Clostridiaceae bacterium]
MKKIGSSLLILFLLLSILYIPSQNAYAAGDPTESNTEKAPEPYIVIIYSKAYASNDPTREDIYSGESFKLILTLEKNGIIPDETNVYVEVKDGNYYPKNTSSIKKVESWLENRATVEFDLVYDGGPSKKIPIEIWYDGSTPIKTYVGFNAIPPSPDDNTPSVPVDTSKYAPKLSIVSSEAPTATAGNTVTVPVTIKNVSSYAANNIKITPELESGSPFAVDSFTLSQSIGNLAPGKSAAVNFKFDVDSNAQGKIYPIKLNLSYSNYSGDVYDSSKGIPAENIFIKVINRSTSPYFTINNIDINPQSVNAGENVDISISLYNSGSLDANNVSVSLVGLKDDGFTVVGGTNVKAFKKFYGTGTVPINFTLNAASKMTTGSYGLTLKIDYKDPSGKDVSEEQQFFIPVINNDSPSTGNNKSVPKLILQQYNCNPSIVKAGENFRLNLNFFNTNKDKTIQNIKIYFTMTDASESGNIFTPVNSSNTIFIDSIGPKESISKSLEFFTIPDAKARTYNLTANFEYEDADKNEFKASEIIGIPVNQQVRLETGEISFPPEAYVGQPTPVSLEFFNMGKVMLRNLMVTINGDFEKQNGKYFVGNFDIGGNEYFEASIIPKTAGDLNGFITISFEDPTGKPIEIKKDFTMNVLESPPMPEGIPPEAMKPQNNKKLGRKQWIYIGLGAAAAITALVIIRKKIKKKKGGLTFDE